VIETYDLRYDPTEVGADMVVECWMSQGPRCDDESFDPRVGDWLWVGDDEVPRRRARVTKRDGNRVWVQMYLARLADSVA
jgi:hypothetical protein